MNAARMLVIGAGVAGLSCAREYRRRGGAVIVLERARGVGGRCATRHVDGQAVDFGCPFLHAKSREFSRVFDELDVAGRISGWPVDVREPRLACQPDAFVPGHRRVGRADGVSALPRTLARGLDVRLEHTVTAIETDGGVLRAHVANSASFETEQLVVAGSIAQSLALVEPLVRGWSGAAATLERMRSVTVVPVLTLIAGWPADSPEPGFDAWHPMETTMIAAIYHDSSKRADPKHRVLVVNARPAFSRERLHDDPDAWADDLLWELGELLGPWAARPAWRQAHRWTSGRVRNADLLGQPVVFHPPGGGMVVVIGDAFATTPGVEGAYFSGIATGEMLAVLPDLVRNAGASRRRTRARRQT